MGGVAIEHFADKLVAACRNKGPVCVGLDPVYERLPVALRAQYAEPTAQTRARAIGAFSAAALQAVAEHVPCVKIQSACFERYLWHGVKVCHELITAARALGLVVILDAKRGDIGISSAHYAAGCLADLPPGFLGEEESGTEASGLGADALTVNSYLGADGLEPFVQVAAGAGKGLFALVRTSNPGGDAIQGLKLADGRSVAEAVAQVMATAGAGCVGRSGYSLLGAVVGATKPTDAARLRQLMPQQIFLVPGFGAQGGKADDVKACFKSDGTGAIITASRSVLYAYEKNATTDWTGAIERAAVEMKHQVAAILHN